MLNVIKWLNFEYENEYDISRYFLWRLTQISLFFVETTQIMHGSLELFKLYTEELCICFHVNKIQLCLCWQSIKTVMLTLLTCFLSPHICESTHRTFSNRVKTSMTNNMVYVPSAKCRTKCLKIIRQFSLILNSERKHLLDFPKGSGCLSWTRALVVVIEEQKMSRDKKSWDTAWPHSTAHQLNVNNVLFTLDTQVTSCITF